MDTSAVQSEALVQARKAIEDIHEHRVGAMIDAGRVIGKLIVALENLLRWAENAERQQLNH